MTKSRTIAEYGDFQTPASLARAICGLLAQQGLRPRSLLEPTCGRGNLLLAGMNQFKSVEQAIGRDINADHISWAQTALLPQQNACRMKLSQGDFFDTDWECVLRDLPEPILVLGNPPWVTNADLGALRSQNLPVKSNHQNHDGLDAITGKANFDISEWMLVRLIQAMKGRTGALAMLCKSSVARKVLCHAWKNGIGLENSALYKIDANLHFEAAVDAVLLLTHFAAGAGDCEARVYSCLADEHAETSIGYQNGMMLADVTAYHRWRHLCGEECMKWRSGIKHDCSKVMELRREGMRFRNGLSELIDIEETCLYPMLKSSDVAKGKQATGSRWMIVPQRTVNEDTTCLRNYAPKTWAYLIAHADLLSRRASSIYRGRPPFSVFGVGDYAFAPWKVAISGFYKKLAFLAVGPFKGKPIVLDDTSYFLPFQTSEQAEYAVSLLNSRAAQSFYGAFVFWDSKRPITVDLLGRLGLHQLAKELGCEEGFNRLFGNERGSFLGAHGSRQLELRM